MFSYWALFLKKQEFTELALVMLQMFTSGMEAVQNRGFPLQ
jgi:hypothetical protein